MCLRTGLGVWEELSLAFFGNLITIRPLSSPLASLCAEYIENNCDMLFYTDLLCGAVF